MEVYLLLGEFENSTSMLIGSVYLSVGLCVCLFVCLHSTGHGSSSIFFKRTQYIRACNSKAPHFSEKEGSKCQGHGGWKGQTHINSHISALRGGTGVNLRSLDSTTQGLRVWLWMTFQRSKLWKVDHYRKLDILKQEIVLLDFDK